MKQLFIPIVALLLLSGCKKEEGLSQTTGNLEVTKSEAFVGLPLYYELYSEAGFNLYLANQFCIPIMQGSSKDKTLKIRGLPEGRYGLRFSYDGSHWDQWVNISPNKVNKATLP